mmetsp:Transcript_65243/g.181378  ORF Transcript_65243/g.181378 Transcript_65243/m.181378 type:complete len:223 (-) Transcript_65243:1803-2471(-)
MPSAGAVDGAEPCLHLEDACEPEFFVRWPPSRPVEMEQAPRSRSCPPVLSALWELGSCSCPGCGHWEVAATGSSAPVSEGNGPLLLVAGLEPRLCRHGSGLKEASRASAELAACSNSRANGIVGCERDNLSSSTALSMPSPQSDMPIPLLALTSSWGLLPPHFVADAMRRTLPRLLCCCCWSCSWPIFMSSLARSKRPRRDSQEDWSPRTRGDLEVLPSSRG